MLMMINEWLTMTSDGGHNDPQQLIRSNDKITLYPAGHAWVPEEIKVQMILRGETINFRVPALTNPFH